jgi:uncharacterized membrane protein YgaE (UPF0421/DUF939 family)
MAWRMLVSLIVSLAASYYVAGRLGQPVLLGMVAGGVLGLISSFMVGDVPVAQMAARVGWHVVPYAAGLGLGLFLGTDRPLVMAGLVPVIFLQFYLDRLGPYGHLFGVMLFVSYLIGLTQPPGLGAYPDLVIIGAASAGACIIGRALLCWHSPAREMRQTRRAYQAASRRAAARLAQFLESGCTPHSGRRLDRALDHVNTLVLAFDGRLASPLIGGRVAEHLHRAAFDHEHALVTLASASRRFAAEHPPSELLYLITGQLRAIAAGRESDAAAIRRAATVTGGVALCASERSSMMSIAEALDSYRSSLRALERETAPATGEGTSFTGVVALEGALPAGAGPLAHRTAASQARARRWRHSPKLSTITAIQAAVAVAIALPIAYALNGPRFYWGVVGVLIVFGGTNTPDQRGRKLMRRVAGTAIGGVIGVVIHDLIGPEPAWWTIAIVIVAAVTIGAYAMKINYAVFVTCLVIGIAQVYALAVGDLDTTLLYRLAENGTGAVIAVIVATVFLPAPTYSVIRTGLHGYLEGLSAFVADLAQHLTDPNVRIRSDVRAVDHALFQIKDAESLLLPPLSVHANGRAARRRRRAKALIDILRSATGEVHDIAHDISISGHASTGDVEALRRSIGTLTRFIGDAQQPNGRATRRDAPLGLPATSNRNAGAVLDRTVAPLDGLSSQISLLARRIDTGDAADRPWGRHARDRTSEQPPSCPA